MLQCPSEHRFSLLFYSLVGCGVVFWRKGIGDTMNKIKQLVELVRGLFQRKEEPVTKQKDTTSNVGIININVNIKK